MVEEKNAEGETEVIEASGDAIVINQGLLAIAGAITDGLLAIAGAIQKLAELENGEQFGDSESSEYYMDGSRIK